MAEGLRKAKKRNFTEETLVGEVEARKVVLFGGHRIGIPNNKKQMFNMLLRIILSKDDIQKIQIDSLPETLHEFYSFLKSKLGLEGDLVVQYEDREFDNELCNLMSLSDLPEGKATLKITVKQASECRVF
ncbi:unnamed protein product [Boreogadus saida]